MIRDIRSVCYPLKLALNRKDLNLVLIALGIVFSDIGTSVLYAVNELFFGSANVAQNPESIIGVISLLIWTLTLITSFKYMLLVLRADNRGEGGPFALMGLLRRHAVPGTSILIIILLGSASLLFAESILTPAISVMAAIEGLRHVTSTLVPYSVHISIVILLALFAFQRRGTAGVGKCFGPIALIWFVFITSL
ncbi:MAG: KUP/HAK/KT family potassium transporter, partial [bacterium]|nr:KUP/HAK/KT family potassium transporter [bacterium]